MLETSFSKLMLAKTITLKTWLEEVTCHAIQIENFHLANRQSACYQLQPTAADIVHFYFSQLAGN